nr:melanoma-associated antigen B4-like [Manis javanica]
MSPEPKSKHHIQKNSLQAKGDTQGPEGVRPAVAADDAPETTSSPSISVSAFVSWSNAQEGSASQDKQGTGHSQATVPLCRARKHVITRKVNKLGQLLLEKCKTKGQVTQAVLLKIVRRKYKHLFSKNFRRTSELMELLFGLELREANCRSQAYALVSKLGLPDDAILSSDSGLPTPGLIMLLLGVIFMKDNRATEEEVCEFLNTLGVYDGRRHLIFREPLRLITKELVQQKYLEYCQVPNRDPPQYEFLWGAKTHAETSKMKVPEVLAKIKNRVPSSFSNLYEGALRDEKEDLEARAAARVTTRAAAKAGAKNAA